VLEPQAPDLHRFWSSFSRQICRKLMLPKKKRSSLQGIVLMLLLTGCILLWAGW